MGLDDRDQRTDKIHLIWLGFEDFLSRLGGFWLQMLNMVSNRVVTFRAGDFFDFLESFRLCSRWLFSLDMLKQLLLGSVTFVTQQVPEQFISLRILLQVCLCYLSFIRLFYIVFCLNQLYFCLRQGLFSSYYEVGRYLGSFLRQLFMMLTISSGVSWGRGFMLRLRTFCLSQYTSLPEKGWTKVTISQKRQPRDQISLLKEYGSSYQIQGLVQQGVPILVLAIPSLLIELTFISPNLICSPTRKKLAALTSRWRILVRCSPLIPLAISLAKMQNSSSVKCFFFLLRCIISCRKSPRSANSITRQRWSSSKKASRYWMMLGWESLASSLISLRQFNFSGVERQLSFIFFIAQTLPSIFRLAWQTMEKQPYPITLRSSKLCITAEFQNQYIDYQMIRRDEDGHVMVGGERLYLLGYDECVWNDNLARHQYSNNRFIIMKTSLLSLALLSTALIAILYASYSPMPQMSENSANFLENDKSQLRFIVSKAGILYNSNYSALAEYVKNEVTLLYASYWNVFVYSRQDYNAKFYLTGTYDSAHQNKRFFQVTDSQPYGFSILILEQNNTQLNSIVGKESSEVQVNSELQYVKTKSAYVSTSQQAGIDLAITTAYTWNKNIIDFSKVLQKLTETNLNEHWQVCTSYDNLPNFAIRYTSQYEQWMEYSGYGIGATHWHVYIWRNYITG